MCKRTKIVEVATCETFEVFLGQHTGKCRAGISSRGACYIDRKSYTTQSLVVGQSLRPLPPRPAVWPDNTSNLISQGKFFIDACATPRWSLRVGMTVYTGKQWGCPGQRFALGEVGGTSFIDGLRSPRCCFLLSRFEDEANVEVRQTFACAYYSSCVGMHMRYNDPSSCYGYSRVESSERNTSDVHMIHNPYQCAYFWR